ncbi:MAG: DUF1501 domain-containing protein [Acidobacteriota bacterium]
MKTTRRGFLVGCSAAIAGMAGARFNSLALGGGPNDEIFVSVFLRGGMDGLNFVPPIGGVDRGLYETARPRLQVPATGPDAALPLGTEPFGLHPSAAPLHDLFQNGNLAIVHAAGLDYDTRSHFDAMDFMELGTPGSRSTNDGWLTRHFASATNLPAEIIVPSLAIGSNQHLSLLGNRETLNMNDPDDFRIDRGPSAWRETQRIALRRLYNLDDTELHATGRQALDAMDIVELSDAGDYTPANGAEYPNTSFGNHLQTVAQMIKKDLGVRVATVDLGGWDTHDGQGDGSGGYFAGLVDQLARGLAALYLDLDGPGGSNYTSRLTVCVQSEFGRRLRENADRGSDHGHGNVMMVMSGNANGGLYGAWPGLATDQLFDNADLAITTDYRRVLSEILIRRMGNNKLGEVFPGYSGYSPLGLVSGPDLTPDYGAETIFADGFERGNTTAWTTSVE